MADGQTPSYSVSPVNRVKRRHDRGHYDHETVHALLDAAALCHVSYVIDGQPYCTPTLFWREGSRLYWHGSSASRMLRNLSSGEPACLTVTHLDSLILARSGFNHSADYRSVMAFGQAVLVSDPDEKRHALTMMVDRLLPGPHRQVASDVAAGVQGHHRHHHGDRARFGQGQGQGRRRRRGGLPAPDLCRTASRAHRDRCCRAMPAPPGRGFPPR